MQRAAGFILATLICAGCSTSPPLNKWVEDRGYNFHKDYSSINTLGWEADAFGNLSANPILRIIEPIQGQIPDFSKSAHRNFHIDGKAATQKFLKEVVNVEASTDFDNVYSAEIELRNPFKIEATALLPLAPCANKEITVAKRVLNTGEMMIRIYDERDNNITGKLTVKQGGATVALEGSGKDTHLEIGKDLYVGYFPQRYKCAVIASNDNLKIGKGEQINFGGVDFRYLKYRSVQDDAGIAIPIADTYIALSGYYAEKGNTAALIASTSELDALLASLALEERLQSLAEQTVTIAAENPTLQARVLEGSLLQQKQYSRQTDLVFHNYNQNWAHCAVAKPVWSLPPCESDDPSWVKQTAYDWTAKWNTLKSEETKLQQQKPSNVAQLSAQVSAQSKIADEKAAIVARVITSGQQILTSAQRYPLTFGLQLNLPGKRPNSGVYLEVKNVDKENVWVRIQHLILERID